MKNYSFFIQIGYKLKAFLFVINFFDESLTFTKTSERFEKQLTLKQNPKYHMVANNNY